MPLRTTAVLKRARRLREVEVAIGSKHFSVLGEMLKCKEVRR